MNETRAAADGGTAPACHFALVGDGGNVMQQGASPLGNLADTVASARRVVLLLAAADVTLLHVPVPPLSNARLKAAPRQQQVRFAPRPAEILRGDD
eukprot:gene40866-50565_t